MAEKRDFTPHQQKIVRNYYKNQGAIREQSLADLVGDLYLATTEAKTAQLWKRADALLEKMAMPASTRLLIIEKRDARALAEIAAKGFQSDRKADWARDAREERRGDA